MLNRLKPIVMTMALMMPNAANAAIEQLVINDASQVQFTVNPGSNPALVYFRNLNSFGSGWLGCCSYYYIDVSTEGGKAQYATFLSAYFARQKISFYVEKTGGALVHVGNF